ncbi:hypothetical protein GGI15_002289 [Coemansia interrupta]|uniref:GST N-terminal domain-containing protein n=1 Tax=Coemansia interrupta TaxID=1126814 RepID=A0A9W8HIX2_9FUNG|nr:hypothetical protein GGI15_002289 [Coemansia interrupta]
MSIISTSSFTLRYFDFIGLGEASRILLTVAQADWTEENPEWPQEKENQPFGRLPVLVERSANGETDFVLTESPAIERYIGRLSGLLPADPKQAARQEQLREQQIDITTCFFVQLVKDVDMKKAATGKFDDLLCRMFKMHSEALRANGNNGHYFGSELSFIDVTSYAFIKLFVMYMQKYQDDIAAVFKSKITPEFAKLVSVVESDPLMKAYVAKRKMLGPLIAQ